MLLANIGGDNGMKKYCYGCEHLDGFPDGAGGGTYTCLLFPGIVVGEWGHWTNDGDEPTQIKDNCWTRKRNCYFDYSGCGKAEDWTEEGEHDD